MYGNQSGGGATVVTTQVVATANFSNARVAFSSGQSIPSGAPGGSVSASGSAVGVLIVGVKIADLVSYMRGEPRPVPRADGVTMISETCSCYQKPVNSE